MFTQGFEKFVCIGDSITCEVEGYAITARIFPDDNPARPDERQDGFWPSLYKDAAGFIGAGPNWRARFDTARAHAEAVMEAWEKDEWFYGGIVLSVSFEGVHIVDHAASLWGIEANYPDGDNAYLTQAANKLLPEAILVANAERARLCALLCGTVS